MYSNGASSINSSYRLNEMENCRFSTYNGIDYGGTDFTFTDDNDDSIREHHASSFGDSIDDEDDCFVFESQSAGEK